LKKQSQFSVTHISVNSLKKGNYGKILLRGAQENKAKQTQFNAPFLPEGKGEREKILLSADSSDN